jgi:hypothetical protein
MFGLRYPHPFTPGLLPSSLRHLILLDTLQSFLSTMDMSSLLACYVHMIPVVFSVTRGAGPGVGDDDVEYEGKIEKELPQGCEMEWYTTDR